MNVVTRVRNILISPKSEWPVIEAEPSTVGSLYTGYLMLLAAIPAVAGFIGMSLIGVGALGFSVRMSIGSGIANMAVSYVLSLAACAILALVIDGLAPTFGGQKNRIAAFKVAVYGSTAAMVGGIFGLLPALSMLGIIPSLYSIYLLYLGLPVLMKCAAGKAAGYTAVTIIVAFVLGAIIGAVSSAFRPDAGAGLAGGGGFTLSTPEGKVTVDPSGNGSVTVQTEDGTMSVNTGDLGRRMEEFNRNVQAAQQAGNAAELEQLSKEAQEALEQSAPSE